MTGFVSRADRGSVRYLMKFSKKLFGRKDIEDALIKLNRLTQEEVNMAIAETRKLAHQINIRVNQIIDGTSCTLATHEYHLEPTNVQTNGKRKLVRRKRGVSSPLVPLLFVAQT